MPRATASVLRWLLGWAASLSIAGHAASCELGIQMVPALTLHCPAGFTNEIQFTTALMPANTWVTLTNLVLPHTPYEFVDLTADGGSQRFYRVLTLGQGPDIPPGTPAPVYFHVFSHQEAVGSVLTGFDRVTNFVYWLTNDLALYESHQMVTDQYFSDFMADVLLLKGQAPVLEAFRKSGQNLGYHFHPPTWDVNIRSDQIAHGEFHGAVSQYPYWESAYYDWHPCVACGAYEACGYLTHWDNQGDEAHGGIGLMQEVFGKTAVVESASLLHAPVAWALRDLYPNLRVSSAGNPHAYHNAGLLAYLWKSDFQFSPDPYQYAYKLMGNYYMRTHSQARIERTTPLTAINQMLALLPRDRPHLVSVHIVTPDVREFDDPLPALLTHLEGFITNNPGSRFISLAELPRLVRENPHALTMPDLEAAANGFLRGWHGRPPAFASSGTNAYSLATLFKALQFALQAHGTRSGPWPALIEVPIDLLPPLGLVEHLDDPRDMSLYDPIPRATFDAVIAGLPLDSIPYTVLIPQPAPNQPLTLNAAELLSGMAAVFLNDRTGTQSLNVVVQKGHIVPLSNVPNETDNTATDPRTGYATDRLNWYDQLQLWTLEPLELRTGAPSNAR